MPPDIGNRQRPAAENRAISKGVQALRLARSRSHLNDISDRSEAVSAPFDAQAMVAGDRWRLLEVGISRMNISGQGKMKGSAILTCPRQAWSFPDCPICSNHTGTIRLLCQCQQLPNHPGMLTRPWCDLKRNIRRRSRSSIIVSTPKWSKTRYSTIYKATKTCLSGPITTSSVIHRTKRIRMPTRITVPSLRRCARPLARSNMNCTW